MRSSATGCFGLVGQEGWQRIVRYLFNTDSWAFSSVNVSLRVLEDSGTMARMVREDKDPKAEGEENDEVRSLEDGICDRVFQWQS